MDLVVFGGDDQREVRVYAVLGNAASGKGTEDEFVEDLTLVN